MSLAILVENLKNLQKTIVGQIVSQILVCLLDAYHNFYNSIEKALNNLAIEGVEIMLIDCGVLHCWWSKHIKLNLKKSLNQNILPFVIVKQGIELKFIAAIFRLEIHIWRNRRNIYLPLNLMYTFPMAFVNIVKSCLNKLFSCASQTTNDTVWHQMLPIEI